MNIILHVFNNGNQYLRSKTVFYNIPRDETFMAAKYLNNQRGLASIGYKQFENKIKGAGIENTTLTNSDKVFEICYQTKKICDINVSFHTNE